MKSCRSLVPALVLLLLAGCGGSSSVDRAVPQVPAPDQNGDPVDGVITAVFDPSAGEIPFPNSLLLSGTTDLTLNPPVADPNNFGDPAVALSALDGFSTISPWTFNFTAPLNPSTIVPGSSVRFYEVSFAQGTAAVTGVNRELVPGQDYVAAVAGSDPSGQTLAIVPLRPLQEMTGYMAILTSDLADHSGNPATPAQTYFLAKRPDPLVTSDGTSTEVRGGVEAGDDHDVGALHLVVTRLQCLDAISGGAGLRDRLAGILALALEAPVVAVERRGGLEGDVAQRLEVARDEPQRDALAEARPAGDHRKAALHAQAVLDPQRGPFLIVEVLRADQLPQRQRRAVR